MPKVFLDSTVQPFGYYGVIIRQEYPWQSAPDTLFQAGRMESGELILPASGYPGFDTRAVAERPRRAEARR